MTNVDQIVKPDLGGRNPGGHVLAMVNADAAGREVGCRPLQQLGLHGDLAGLPRIVVITERDQCPIRCSYTGVPGPSQAWRAGIRQHPQPPPGRHVDLHVGRLGLVEDQNAFQRARIGLAEDADHGAAQ
jgi:hypothetical protein